MARPRNGERRSTKRVRCAFKGAYRLAGQSSRPTETRDLSDGGLLMLVSGDVRQGDVLDLTIPLTPAGSPLRARGRVVYLRETPGARILAGVQFLGLSARHREALGKKIRDRMLRGAARVAARC
ncbi:MAG: PilZ domain-containing protein [Candidatus Aureabacteria bacterium]|nr:PilZ domain-containing protein [Candidatus Auribacterota bacterium]HQM53701.1 PilZ domain-containing protein [bacterium]